MRASVAVVALGCLALAAPAAGAGSGLRVHVVSSPTCPVERMPPDPMCAPRPFAASVRVVRLSDGHVVARLHTGADGRSTVGLRPGRYSLRVRPESGAQLPRCPAVVKTTVRSGSFVRVTVNCDSGIR